MSKKIILLILLILIPINVFAYEREEVTLSSCVDGDTATFIYKNKKTKFRFLGIDTPESTKEIEDYGIEASDFTCDKLKHANKIEIEFDEHSDKKDKYDRYLAYIFVDDELLEEDILFNGLANVKYITKKYKYYDTLIKAENHAKANFIGVFSTEEYERNLFKELIFYFKKNGKKILSNIYKEFFK